MNSSDDWGSGPLPADTLYRDVGTTQFVDMRGLVKYVGSKPPAGYEKKGEKTFRHRRNSLPPRQIEIWVPRTP